MENIIPGKDPNDVMGNKGMADCKILESQEDKADGIVTDENSQDNYIFFSSLEMIDFFCNNLAGKDIKTQTKRIFEMARVFLDKKDFALEDIYSVLVMVRDRDQRAVVNEVFRLYFKEGSYPIRVFVPMSELEETADIEMEFSAYRGEKKYIRTALAPIPDEPYSQGVIVEDYVHCSGVLPLEPAKKAKADRGFKDEVRQCLENLKGILEAAGTSLKNVYAIVVYLKDLEKLPELEEVFLEYYAKEDDIIQEVVKTGCLTNEYEIEISCSAFRLTR